MDDVRNGRAARRAVLGRLVLAAIVLWSTWVLRYSPGWYVVMLVIFAGLILLDAGRAYERHASGNDFP